MPYLILIAVAALAVYFYWQNNSIVTTRLVFESDKVPDEFDGFTILHVSDLHNKRYRKDALIKLMEIEAPDIIAVTGDIINTYRLDADYAKAWAKQAAGIAPVYYVSGNHELRSGIYEELLADLKAAGLCVLDNKAVRLSKDRAHINLVGLAAAGYFGKENPDEGIKKMLRTLKEENALNILLAHQPEKIGAYSAEGVDLCLCGHAHGGQVRLPFVGGLLAPGQGLFPRYESGMNRVGDTTMVVSRGLSNSGFPFRVANRPELIVITLKKSHKKASPV